MAMQQRGRLCEAVEQGPTFVAMEWSREKVEYVAGEGAGFVGLVGA
jgi:hypothetical protein